MILAARRLSAALLSIGLGWSTAAAAASVPVPPCARLAALPALPADGAPPNFAVWRGDALDRTAPVPACLGWPDFDFSIMLAMAGRFRHPGGVEAVLAGFGRFSSMTGLKYWSISDERWQVLLERSAAVTDPETRQARPDFAPGEFVPGRDLYFLQRENRGREDIVYRLHVLTNGPDGFSVSVTNVSSINFLFIRLFAPGDLNSVYFFRRLGNDDWGYWAVGGTHLGLTGLFGPHIGSFENRAMAIYRHFAGIPEDQEPPAATEE
ncbi:hypothetical protein GCM10011611_32860 [Aliidongia dinghuensis]|uniref:DUF1349 domain-containing protein n=1 Tax=Aliidongia dinghuensis TaxID=1867774 RepID=A0A8J3E5T6_9PROT|nr:DUF6675 family protein [Aliidongia dinghuensis]GGF24240.1 hypothetical protein GCM10011611_32860 [Aliidongia dinghuensis]